MKANVLHLIDSFEQGGTERQVIQLVRLLCESGRYGVRLACFDGRGTLRGEVEPLSLGEIPEFPLNNFYDRNAVRQLRRFVRYLRQNEIRLVHAHGFYTNTFGVTGAWLARVPARIASRRETEGFRTPAQNLLEQRITFRLANAVVVNAEAIRRRLVADGVSAAKIVTLYNGLDTSRVAPRLSQAEALARFSLPAGRRFVTIVANVNHPIKDHPTFLRAARRVREAVPDAAFVVAGEGRLLEEHRAMAAHLGIGDDVFFTGRCDSVGDLLAVSDVCVLSSIAEGFSNSILEYMAAARPVVVTDVGGAREAVEEGETGYLVASGDDETMAARVVGLLADPLRAREMGERGRRLIERKFSSGAQLGRAEALYERLLAGRSPLAHELAGERV